MARIAGILNVTRDSHSDGGLFLDPAAAISRGREMLGEGAAMIDVGAESSHPDAEDVPAGEQIRRLTPVVEALIADGARVSVDAYDARVVARMLELGVSCINDITALRDPRTVEVLRGSGASIVLMHSTSHAARAERSAAAGGDWPARIASFFEARIAALERAEIARERLILDPGLGFFLSSDPEPSLQVLRRIRELRRLGLPLLVSPSRKSFVGSVLGRGVHERGAGTLAAELWCAREGVDWIRTHDVRALADALRLTEAIERA
jgi:dihydropteroate synthase